MKYRKFGNTGIEVSEIGFGAWALGGDWWGEQNDDESVKALNKALDLGVNFIDTAAVYGDGRSEKIIAKTLKDRNNHNEKIYIATKLPPTDGYWPPSPFCELEERYSEKYIRENLEQRLKNLQIDCIDLVQLHTWTRAWNKNPVVFDILQKLKKEGKLKFIGVSTPEHDQDAVCSLMKEGLVDSVQVIYNYFEQQPSAELLPTALETNTAIIARIPLDEGLFTDKFDYNHKFSKDDFRLKYFGNNRLKRSLERFDLIKDDIKSENLNSYSQVDVALKFVLANESVSCTIPGIRNVKQAQLNCDVSDKDNLPKSLINKLQKRYWYKGFWYFDNPPIEE